MNEFERLKREAEEAIFQGWDLSFLEGRFIENELSWNYEEIVKSKIKKTDTLLDMGTGGGEFLLSLKDHLPLKTFATEGYKPNVEIARKTLEPLEIDVVEIDNDDALPFGNEAFDIIINRHESFSSNELLRILKQKGIFVTQQVGEMDNIELNRFFNDYSRNNNEWCMANAIRDLGENGLTITFNKEEFIDGKFLDIGAVIYYLKVITWQIPDFNIEENIEKLKELCKKMKKENGFATRQHRFLVIGVK